MAEIFEFRKGEMVMVNTNGCYLSGSAGFIQEMDYVEGLFGVFINGQLVQIKGEYLTLVPSSKYQEFNKKEGE